MQGTGGALEINSNVFSQGDFRRCGSTKNKCRPQGERESQHASKFLLGEDMPAKVEDRLKESEEESRKYF